VAYPESDRFVVGANLPWIGYGTDIGTSAWHPTGGLSAQPDALDLLDRTLAALAADGVSVVRTFLLCDARSGVRFADDGVPVGLDDAVFPDIDAMLAAARRHDVRLMPVLLDFHLCKSPRIVDGVQLGGRARLLTDPDARQALVDFVLRPIVERYGDDEAIAAWDVMNEPEWCLGVGPLSRRRGVAFDALQEFLGQAVRCVRASARQPVTIGCAGTRRLELVRPLGLDFYQVHWYERFGWTSLARPVADLDLAGRPVILGEFPGRSRSVADVLDAAKRAGYAGALVWSVLAEDDQSAYPADLGDWVRAGAD
jgi:hypothetical protein